MTHRDTYRAPVQRIGAATAEYDGVDVEPGRVAEDRTQVLVIIDSLEHRHGPRAVDHVGDTAFGGPARRGEHPAVEVKADRLRHHLRGDAIEGRGIAGQIRLEFGESTVGA